MRARQYYSVKSKIMEEIDTLDPDDRHYIIRKSDLDERLYRMYDKIEEAENNLMDARAKKQAIEADKITGDNIYKVLVCFEKLYNVMNTLLAGAMKPLNVLPVFEKRTPVLGFSRGQASFNFCGQRNFYQDSIMRSFANSPPLAIWNLASRSETCRFFFSSPATS